jgi:hypothetical protein
MNYISEYEDLKFEAEMLKSIAFGVVIPFGVFIMQIFAHEINLTDVYIPQLLGAIASLNMFLILVRLSYAKMESRERLLKWLHRRGTL